MVTWPGIIMVASIITITNAFPLKSYFASANPASDEKKSWTQTMVDAMKRLLTAKRPNSGTRVARSVKFRTEGFGEKKVYEKRSDGLLKAAAMSQTSGIRVSAEKAVRARTVAARHATP